MYLQKTNRNELQKRLSFYCCTTVLFFLSTPPSSQINLAQGGHALQAQGFEDAGERLKRRKGRSGGLQRPAGSGGTAGTGSEKEQRPPVEQEEDAICERPTDETKKIGARDRCGGDERIDVAAKKRPIPSFSGCRLACNVRTRPRQPNGPIFAANSGAAQGYCARPSEGGQV